jgi:hypothetical protein
VDAPILNDPRVSPDGAGGSIISAKKGGDKAMAILDLQGMHAHSDEPARHGAASNLSVWVCDYHPSSLSILFCDFL